MPSLSDILKYAAPAGAQVFGGLRNRAAAGSATRRLAGAADTAATTIQGGADAARRTMADVYAGQQRTLAPYQQAGEKSLGELSAGLEPGGEFRQPFTRATEFTWMPPDLEKDPMFQRRLEQGRRIIEAGANAGGIRFSGATMKDFADYATGEAQKYLTEDYARAENTFGENYARANEQFRTNQAVPFDRLQTMATAGQNAANQEVAAGSAYGANLSRLQQTTAAQLAELQTEKANAEAEGDYQKAGAINDMISGILDTVNRTSMAKAAQKVAGVAGPAVAAGVASGTVGAVPGIMAPILPAGATGVMAPSAAAVPALAPGVAASAPLTGYAGGGLVTSQGPLIGMMTNPITIGVAAGIIGITALLKSQAHHEANTWVQGFQNKFDANMDQINRGFFSAAQSGQLSKEEAMQIRDEAAAAMQAYEQKRQSFSAKGKDEKTVANQALQTFNKYYGVNGQDFLGKMDAVIQGLA